MCDECCNSGEEEGGDNRTNKTGTEMLTNGGVTSLEDIFECLIKPRRRFLLYYLQENEIAEVEELAAQIVAWENDIPPSGISTESWEPVLVDLVHTHLPKLADMHFIEYDRRSRTVRYSNPPALLDRILRLLARFEDDSTE